ncbi:MAG: L,D-transpeptidase [Roseitalea porphyridii]|jgi:lipoprotein-anchoring transpeptidase ErfK/SrfK|uniref:Murein L,D-transpeptidase n=1 Tax=Roseitalea porphyridii TaxID=1852022 RepID=A0A4P6V1S6_9HYPH|nr:L,D-transpeptidase [Roseitalea porphyridii]QBK31322.1 murein L,D-transpeptidase [Roseitalea porphyridii]
MRHYLLTLALAVAIAFPAAGEAMAARLIADVDLSSQTMTVKKDGRVLYRWPVSTARPGKVTPVGTFRPQRMHRKWRSTIYGSNMPYSIFFRGPYAIHGTSAVSRLGSPASAGCVRLHTSNAKRLFDLTRQVGPGNMRVRIRH